MNKKLHYIFREDSTLYDLKRYGCRGMFNEEVETCKKCKVKEECKKNLNPWIRMANTALEFGVV